MVDLENKTNRMQSFNLDHPACHEAGYGEVKRGVQMEYTIGNATPQARQVVRRLPGSLTFLARSTLTGLHNSVLFAPEVARALKSGVLVMKAQYESNVATESTAFIDPSTQEPVGSDKSQPDQGRASGSTKKGRE